MTVTEIYILKETKPLRLEDKLEKAVQLLEDSGYSHLAVVRKGVYEGTISLKQAEESSLLLVPKCVNHDYIEYIIEMEFLNKKRTVFEMRRCGFLEVNHEPKFLESDRCYHLFIKLYKEHVKKKE